jgi:DNA helicase-2/ATP-dependent DNA helicase PcrA
MLSVDGDEEAQNRLENLQELLGNVQEFVADRPGATLADYLEQTSLVAGERAEGDRSRAVTLMTVHSAKGLEYDEVYLTGMEERVFPHARVIDDPVQLEEERRLAYVAITRARKRLTLTMVARRQLYGQTQAGTPSRFVLDMPRDSIATAGRPAGGSGRNAARPGSPVLRRPEPSWNDDVVYDVDPGVELSSDELGGEEGVMLYVGMHVRHKDFGVGELLGWAGVGPQLKFNLRFPKIGMKTILARFCEPV